MKSCCEPEPRKGRRLWLVGAAVVVVLLAAALSAQGERSGAKAGTEETKPSARKNLH